MNDNSSLNIGYVTVRDMITEGSSIARSIPQPVKRLIINNPHIKEDDPIFFFLTIDGIIISKISIFPEIVTYRGKSMRWFWGQDFYTEPTWRGKGYGKQLIESMLSELNSRNIIFGAYAMSKSSKRLWPKCGLVEIGRVPRHFLILNSNPFLESYINTRLLKTIFGNVMNGFLQSIKSIVNCKTKRSGNMFIVQEIGNFSFELDNLILHNQPVLWIERSSPMMNWKLNHARENLGNKKTYKAFYIKKKNDNSVVGYFIIRFGCYDNLAGRPYKNIKLTTLVDMFYDARTPGILDGLIYHILNESYSLGSDVVEIITSCDGINKLLHDSLFFHKGGYDLWCSMPPNCILMDDYCRNLSNWHITAGESDAFFF